MFFIQSAQRQFRPNNLIINAKITDYFQNFDFSKEEFDRCYSIMQGSEPISLKENEFISLFLPILYYVSSSNKEAIEVYKTKYLNNSFLRSNMPDFEKMFVIFNIIEYEKKYNIRKKEDLQILFDELTKFNKKEKTFENFLLLKYYEALLKYLLKDYTTTMQFTNEIIMDIKDEIEKKNLMKTQLIKYIQMVNSLLSIKVLEIEDKERNKGEILNCLECLYEGAKTQKEEMAIKLGLKIFILQASNMDYLSCIKILEEILKILHKEMLFGRSHKNIVEQYLYVSGLLAYYNVLIGNFKEVHRFSKKISKSIQIITDSNPSANQTKWNESLVPKYKFFQGVLNSIVGQEMTNVDKTDINALIDSLNQLNLNESFKDPENMILNAFILTKNKSVPSVKTGYETSLTRFSSILESKNKKIDNSRILGFFFYLYNDMLKVYNEYLKTKNDNLLKKLREGSINLIYFTSGLTPNNTYLQNLFRANYFKELFNKLFFFHTFCFYAEKNYQKVLSFFEEYSTTFKVQFELVNDKGYYSLKKVKADSLFKLKRYREAATEYSQIAGNVKDKGTVYFNLGICYIMLKEISNAREFLELALEEFKSVPQKCETIKSIMKKLQ